MRRRLGTGGEGRGRRVVGMAEACTTEAEGTEAAEEEGIRV